MFGKQNVCSSKLELIFRQIPGETNPSAALTEQPITRTLIRFV